MFSEFETVFRRKLVPSGSEKENWRCSSSNMIHRECCLSQYLAPSKMVQNQQKYILKYGERQMVESSGVGVRHALRTYIEFLGPVLTISSEQPAM